jgi:hypothetical protein
MTRLTANQLKGMTLALADTLIIAASLAMWLRFTAQDARALASTGLTFALPFGAIVGKVAMRDHDRLEAILLASLVLVAPCVWLQWTLGEPRAGGSLLVLAAVMWAPTSLLAIVLERWTRPEPPIPTCAVYKTLL